MKSRLPILGRHELPADHCLRLFSIDWERGNPAPEGYMWCEFKELGHTYMLCINTELIDLMEDAENG